MRFLSTSKWAAVHFVSVSKYARSLLGRPSVPGDRMESQIGQNEPFPTLDGASTMNPAAANSASFARFAKADPVSDVPLNPTNNGRGPVVPAGGKISTNE